MIIKKHNANGKIILAICDKDILGKTFEQGDAFLDLNSEFYKGKKAQKKEIIEEINKAYIINAAGKKTVQLLIKEGFALNSSLKYVENIPYIQVIVEKTKKK